MPLRTLLSLLIPLACSGLFVRLGLWQTDRHRERATINSALSARLAQAPVPLKNGGMPLEGADRQWTRVTVTGRFRYDLEQILAARMSEGSPGVHLLTPLEVPGRDTLIIVTRGWVYSPDAATADRARWREADSVTLAGYLLPLPAEGPPAPTDATLPLRSPNRSALESRIGQPVAAVQIVMTSDSLPRADSVPKRLPPPVLDAGPHRSYAIQWFSFAIIAVVGGVILFRRSVVADRANG